MFKKLRLFLFLLLLTGCGTATIKVQLPEEIKSDPHEIRIGLCKEELFLHPISIGTDRAFSYSFFLREHIQDECIQIEKDKTITVSTGFYWLAIAYSFPSGEGLDKYEISPKGEIRERRKYGYWQDRIIILNSQTIKVTTKTRDGVSWR